MKPMRAQTDLTLLSQLIILLIEVEAYGLKQKIFLILNCFLSLISLKPGHSSFHSSKVLIECGKFEGAFSFRLIFFLLWVECSHGCSNSKGYSCFHIHVLKLILRIPEEIDFRQNLWVISSGHFLQVLLL